MSTRLLFAAILVGGLLGPGPALASDGRTPQELVRDLNRAAQPDTPGYGESDAEFEARAAGETTPEYGAEKARMQQRLVLSIAKRRYGW
jgi:hypothetical protein